MSLIEKIDAEIEKLHEEQRSMHSGIDADRVWLKIDEAEKIKQIILSEQKEPCGWCKGEYRFEFNWIDKDGNTVTTGDHMVIGGIADYCPVCGRPLNQPYTDR